MALSGDETTFNAAVDTFWAAWKTYLDTLSAGDEVRIVFPKTGIEGSSFPGFDPTQGFRVLTFKDETGLYPHKVGDAMPLFWKVTNGAGETS